MITYLLDDKLSPLAEPTTSEEDTCIIQILTAKEYEQQYHDAIHYAMLHYNMSHIHCCKADVLNNFTAGTFNIPCKHGNIEEKHGFAFCMTSASLLFVDDHGFVAPIIEQLKNTPLAEVSIPCFLFSFMEYLIKDDVLFLQQFEENLSEMEEKLLDKTGGDFNKQIFRLRRTLATMSSYYEQMQDMGEDLRQGIFALENEKQCRLFGLFADRCQRLYSDVQMLKEYSMQLREMHQTQVDIKQNQIMKLLTVVTTIFMPLTLITGWYGMNFKGMPELASPYGYGIVCAVSVVIILIECWLFYIKKWFD